jgi:hypothetical protein
MLKHQILRNPLMALAFLRNCDPKDTGPLEVPPLREPLGAAGRPTVSEARSVNSRGVKERGTPMNKLLFALVATLVAVSVSGCVGIGKGKGPPPVVTKG